MVQAQGAFGWHGGGTPRRRDWGTSLLASCAIYIGLAIAVVTLGSAAKKAAKTLAVDVKFVEKIVNGSPH